MQAVRVSGKHGAVTTDSDYQIGVSRRPDFGCQVVYAQLPYLDPGYAVIRSGCVQATGMRCGRVINFLPAFAYLCSKAFALVACSCARTGRLPITTQRLTTLLGSCLLVIVALHKCLGGLPSHLGIVVEHGG